MPPDAKRGVKVVTAIFVGMLIAAFLMPTVIGAVADDDTSTYTQDVGETVELKPGLNATVDSVTDGTSATYTVDYDGDSASTTVNVGANDTVTVSGVDVTIAPQEATSTNATTEYTYPTTVGWGAAGSLWVIIPVFLVLPVFMLAVRYAVDQT